jgi:acetyl/propionyl-CoA carboxylase alpha subunit
MPGVIRSMEWPSGAGTQRDTNVDAKSAVSPYYDSLLGLIVHGPDRDAAIWNIPRPHGLMMVGPVYQSIGLAWPAPSGQPERWKITARWC